MSTRKDGAANGVSSRARRAGALLAALAVLAAPAGCDDDGPTVPVVARLDELTFRAEVHVRESFPVQLGFRLVARNVSDHPVDLLTDGCGLRARAYRTPARAGPAVWDGGPDGACRAGAAPIAVPAGDTVLWTRDVPAGEVLGDSLPDGLYHFTAGLGSAGVASSENVRRIEVRAGEAELALPR